MPDMHRLLQLAVEKEASDLHLVAGLPPVLRISGRLIPLNEEPLSPRRIQDLVYGMMTDLQKARFDRELELDFSVALTSIGRFRVNAHRERGSMGAAVRVVRTRVRSFKELGLPPVVKTLSDKPNGLVLVTGPTGMGKTTTLAAMVDYISRARSCNVVSVEDPIEYVFTHGAGIIRQREVGSDTRSFAAALRHVLRQDPDVILVGEMRDLETISSAITAAETGHLVLATLHTPDVPQTVDRIIDVFPAHQQQQVRIQVASCLQGVVAQQLIPRVDGVGRVLALEILVATAGVRHLIRQAKTEQLTSAMQTGGEFGMVTMDASIASLHRRQVISFAEAQFRVKDERELAD